MDICVTVPKSLWAEWLTEPDTPEHPEPDVESHFWVSGLPAMQPGGRVYIVAHDRVRGYAPLVRMERRCSINPSRSCLVRAGGAVAVTIPETVRGFQGWRERWWDRAVEVPFPNWRDTAGAPPPVKAPVSPSFLERLEPELTLADLEQRANKAYEIAQAAQAAGDMEKLARAVERWCQRWQQWEDLAPPALKTPHVYTQRAHQACDLLDPLSGDEPVAMVLMDRAYFFGARSEGKPAEQATREASGLIERWTAAGPVPVGSPAAPASTATSGRARRVAS